MTKTQINKMTVVLSRATKHKYPQYQVVVNGRFFSNWETGGNRPVLCSHVDGDYDTPLTTYNYGLIPDTKRAFVELVYAASK